jgi:hypothetical protein
MSTQEWEETCQQLMHAHTGINLVTFHEMLDFILCQKTDAVTQEAVSGARSLLIFL